MSGEARAVEPTIEERFLLRDTPSRADVESFVLTRSSESAWAEINRRVSSTASSLLWITGPAGSGKSHFLHYVFALSARTGPVTPSSGRHLTLAITESSGISLLERHLAKGIASQLARSGKNDTLWRDLADADALEITLGQAKRQGVNSITVVIDCGLADEAATAKCERTLLGLVQATREPKLLLIVAARTRAHAPGVRVCEITHDRGEEALIAIARARRMMGQSSADGDVRTASGETADSNGAIFPFHPLAAAAMAQLAPERGRIAEITRMAYEVLQRHGDEDEARLIWPGDLSQSPRIRELIAERLGDQGAAAIRIANAAVWGMEEPRRAIAQEIVDLLLLHCASHGATPLELQEVAQQLSVQSHGGEELYRSAEELAGRSGAVILFDHQTHQLRFNIYGSDAPAIANFNASLELTRYFEPSLPQVTESQELDSATNRLRMALGAALETACRNRDILIDLAKRSATSLTQEQAEALNEFIALAESGPAGVIVSAEHAEKRARERRIMEQYQGLAALAEAAPRIHAMREYLLGMGLHEIRLDELNRDSAIVKLETECRVMIVEVNAAVHVRGAAQLDALEARFERFKWSYATYYQAAHEEWRAELGKIETILEEGKKYRSALRRLQTIPALGSGSEVCDEFDRLNREVVRCRWQGRLAPEITPRCPSCHFVIGTTSPRSNLDEITTQIRRLLEGKLAQLSQGIVRRLIRHHQGNHRLEGFLKMTQAAQAGALIDMLDDELTAYLGELLEETRVLEQRRVIARLASSSSGPANRAERTSPHKRRRQDS
jgi:hypothetical protein